MSRHSPAEALNIFTSVVLLHHELVELYTVKLDPVLWRGCGGALDGYPYSGELETNSLGHLDPVHGEFSWAGR